MKRRAPIQFISILFLLLITGQTGHRAQRDHSGQAAYAQEKPDIFRSDQSVFILAWKKRGYYDRDLMDQLHRNTSQKSRDQIARDADVISGRITLGRSRAERVVLDRPVPFILPGGGSDEDLREKIGEQFRKQKKFKLVDTVEQADIVFLVQGDYVFSFGLGSSDGSSSNPASDENGPNALARLKAVAITAATYRDRPSRMIRKLDSAPWRGEEVGEVKYDATFEEASAEKLVKRFHQEALNK
jgi:hypothetical protein